MPPCLSTREHSAISALTSPRSSSASGSQLARRSGGRPQGSAARSPRSRTAPRPAATALRPHARRAARPPSASGRPRRGARARSATRSRSWAASARLRALAPLVLEAIEHRVERLGQRHDLTPAAVETASARRPGWAGSTAPITAASRRSGPNARRSSTRSTASITTRPIPRITSSSAWRRDARSRAPTQASQMPQRTRPRSPQTHATGAMRSPSGASRVRDPGRGARARPARQLSLRRADQLVSTRT